MSLHTITGTTDNFDAEVLKSSTPVLVDFWAEWCGPCKSIAPMLDEIAAETTGTAKVVKIDVDKNPTLAGQYNVRSIPTLLFFKEGTVRDTQIGGTGKKVLLDKLNALVG